MSTTDIVDHVLGTYGQIIRVGPFLDTDGVTPRDMTTFAITSEFYPKAGPLEAGGAGVGTVDGYVEYRIQVGDLGALGLWGARLFATDADERLASELLRIKVVPPSGVM